MVVASTKNNLLVFAAYLHLGLHTYMCTIHVLNNVYPSRTVPVQYRSDGPLPLLAPQPQHLESPARGETSTLCRP